MQKLSGKLQNVPRSTSPASSPTSKTLNKEATPSEPSKVLTDNNSEENPRSGKSEQDSRVPVLNMHGEPLMPTKPQKARKLLEQGKAKVVQRTPFTIQFKYPTGEAKQDITLGVDAGYSKIGWSTVTEKTELLAGELELRQDIPRLLEKRRMYRRNRRSRKWYREPRFDNRGKKDGWLPPSLEHKLQSHIKLVNQLKKIFPITKTIIEVATFDTQKMQNPEIEGTEYQQGELQGYEVKEYLLEKWGRECAYCGETDIPLEVEHITPKSRGGTDRVSNLTISCHNCNQNKGKKTAKEFGHPSIQKKAKKSLKSAAFMNTIRWKIVDKLNCDYTYGYITKKNRIELGLDKSHVNDAFVIAGGNNHTRSQHIHKAKQVRRQNRKLFKANFSEGGKKKRNTVKEVNGFKRFDKVDYKGKECFIFGLRRSGYFHLRDIEGDKIHASAKSKKLRLLERANGKIEEVKRRSPPARLR